jgi:hypothetical protein
MVKYRFNCRAAPFGCLTTRCRREGIKGHEGKCPLVAKYRTYINAKERIPLLEQELERLQLKLSKIQDGHVRVELESEDMREFHAAMLKDKVLCQAWEKLYASRKQDGIEAMIVLFLAKSKRFWKMSQCKQFVDVKGYFMSIRTFDQIHTLPIGEFASCLYSEFSLFLEYELDNLGYKDEERFAKVFEIDKLSNLDYDCIFAINFVRSALYNEVRRRRKRGPVKYKNVSLILEEQEPERRAILI